MSRTINQQIAIIVGYDEGWVDRNPRSVPDFEHDWSETGPLIERHKIEVEYWKCGDGDCHWRASSHGGAYDEEGEYIDDSDGPRFGKTILKAVCNHIIAKKALDNTVST